MRILNTQTVPGENMLRGTLQYFLAQNIGQRVRITFLIGTQNTTERAGEIYLVGTSYIVLYDERNRIYTLCNLYSIKFITVLNDRTQPVF